MLSVIIEIIIMIGVKLSKKVLKFKCLFVDLIIILGGLLINVVVLFIFENSIFEIK